jgi:hypothetical protein
LKKLAIDYHIETFNKNCPNNLSPKDTLIALYRDCELLLRQPNLSEFDMIDASLVLGWLQAYFSGEKPAYVFEPRFFRDLVKSQSDIPLSMICNENNEHKYLSLEFPRKIQAFKDGSYCDSLFVLVGCIGINNQQGLSCLAPAIDKYGNHKDINHAFLYPLQNLPLREVLEKCCLVRGVKASITEEFADIIIKCLFYLKSKNSDIKPVIPEPPVTKKPKRLRYWRKENYTLDHQIVGYSFHGRNRYIDESSVRGHYKFIRCGKDRKNWEYRWWNPHTRNYG